MTSAGGTTIAWIDAPGDSGTWGVPEQLALPLADRGLALADGLFETFFDPKRQAPTAGGPPGAMAPIRCTIGHGGPNE